MVVMAHSTMQGFKGRIVTATEVARDLGVRYVLSGNVLASEDR
jgi:TolB-like protein